MSPFSGVPVLEGKSKLEKSGSGSTNKLCKFKNVWFLSLNCWRVKNSNFLKEYLRENEAICENTLTSQSKAQLGQFGESK